MIGRSALLAVLATCVASGLLAVASLADAQPATKTYRIGVLGQGNPPTDAVPGADFRQGLRD